MLVKPIIIVGKMGSGKTSVADYLCKVYSTNKLKYEKVVTYTTRERRYCEPLNAYHFVSNDEFVKKIQNGDFIEYVTHQNSNGGIVHYGSTYEDYEAYVSPDDITYIKVAIVDPEGLKNLLNKIGPKNMTVIMLSVHEPVLLARLKQRGSESEEEIMNRLAAEKESFRKISCYSDFTINCDHTPVEQVANMIDQYVHGNLF